MKRLLQSLTTLSLSAAIAFPALADVAKPTVREGDFYCFRGMPEQELNVLPALRSNARPMFRIDKLGNSKFDNTDGHDLREVRTSGDYKVLVVLVEFSDIRFQRQWGDPTEIVNDMLNSDNYTFQGATGSAKDYFQRISQGQFNPQYDVVGPVQVSKKEIDYVTSNPDDTYIDEASGKPVTVYPAGRMVEEVVKALEDTIDFTQYDSDNDGYVDFVYLFFAGQGATTGGDRYHNIWPHAFTLNSAIGAPVEVDGVKVNRYCTSSELGSNRKLSGIGTFCHEFSHVLGLPDLYDTANNNGTASKCFSPGSFSNMDAGNYNNSEHTPPFFSVYEQYAMEWMKPAELAGTGNYTMLPVEARPFGYQVISPNNPQEFFILETRGNSFLDQHLKGHGLLVWHIDFDLGIWTRNTVNNIPDHQRIDIVEADNARDESSRNGDPFPGASGICEFTKSITPSFKDWKGSEMGYDLREISSFFDGTVSFVATGKTEMPAEADLAAPAAKIVSASADAIEIEWPAVENATGYFVSVFDSKEFNGSLLPYSAYAEGWYFKNIGTPEVENGVCHAVLDNLAPNASYGIMVYAINDNNASRMEFPVFASTVDGNDFEAASTNLRLAGADSGAVFADWDNVEGADSYELLIVDRVAGNETNEASMAWDDKRVPESWEADGGKFDTRKYGVAAPSYSLQQPGAYLRTPIYDEQISKLSFWACKRYSDEGAVLDIYALDKNGNPTFAHRLDNLTKDGQVYALEMPAGTYGIKYSYNFNVTDLYVYIDDIDITFTTGYTDNVVPEAEIEYNDCFAAIKGLDKSRNYIAYIYPVKNGERGAKSNEVSFIAEKLPLSGVENIADDFAANVRFRTDGLTIVPSDPSIAYDVYSTDGAAIALGAKGATTIPARGIYIIRAEGRSLKVVL